MKKDEIALSSEVSPGVRLGLWRQGDQTQEVIVGDLKDGAPLQPGTEIVEMGASNDGYWREVKSLYKHSGPAQVATPEYREGYDRIFGKKQKVGVA